METMINGIREIHLIEALNDYFKKKVRNLKPVFFSSEKYTLTAGSQISVDLFKYYLITHESVLMSKISSTNSIGFYDSEKTDVGFFSTGITYAELNTFIIANAFDLYCSSSQNSDFYVRFFAYEIEF